MKTKKQFKRIIIIALVLMALIGFGSVSYGADVIDTAKDVIEEVTPQNTTELFTNGLKNNPVAWGVKGIAYLLAIAFQELALLLLAALRLITVAITGLGSDNDAATIGDIVFNRCGLTSANFFPEVWIGNDIQYSGESIAEIFKNIRTFYYIIRNFSIAILLLVLLYIGIRMAISTVASEEAKYKKMLKDWVVSLVLLFVLHFIIILTFFINNVLVASLADIGKYYGNMPMGSTYLDFMVYAAKPGVGFAYVIVYGAFVVGTLAFAIMYIKRTIVLGFLIVISPLITITYAIDKMGDGKSQALNAWMKEFIFTVIIQPFHCVIYLVFYSSIMQIVNKETDLGALVFAAACAFFMLKAENIVRKIFGVQPNSIGNAIGAGAMALNVTSGLFKGAGKKKVKGKMKDMQNNNVSTIGTPTSNDTQSGATRDSDANNANAGTQTQSTGTGTQTGSQAGSQTGAQAAPQTGPGSAAPASGSAPAQPSSRSNAKKKKSLLKRFDESRVGRLTGGTEGIIRRSISGAATLAGFIAGATVGDFKDAMTIGTATGNIGSAAVDKAEYLHAEEKLYQNQRVMAGGFNDFAEAYRDKHGDVDDEVIIAAAMELMETGGEGLKDQADIDMYKQMKTLSDNAENIGYDDGTEFVENTLRLASEGAVEPTADYVRKVYATSVDTDSDNDNNSSGAGSSSGVTFTPNYSNANVGIQNNNTNNRNNNKSSGSKGRPTYGNKDANKKNNKNKGGNNKSPRTKSQPTSTDTNGAPTKDNDTNK